MRVERLHLQQIEVAGEIDEVLAVMREGLSEPHRYADIPGFLG